MSHEKSIKIQELPEEAAWRLERCDGFLDLRMPGRARKELEAIPAAYQNTVPVLEARFRLATAEEHWETGMSLARRLRDVVPQEPNYWIELAYSTRRGESLEAARSVLMEGLKRFPKLAVIPFNLACYECRLGRRQEALKFLLKSIELDPQYREIALDDADLESLWPVLDP